MAAPIDPTAHVQGQPEPNVWYAILWSGGQVSRQGLQPPYVQPQRKRRSIVAADLWPGHSAHVVHDHSAPAGTCSPGSINLACPAGTPNVARLLL